MGLEFVAINGEDCCGQGDEEYLKRYGLELVPLRWGEQPPRSHELDPVLAVVNIDGVRQELGSNTGTTMGGSQQFDDLMEEIRREMHPRVLRINPWYASDHTVFYTYGVSCIALSSGGVTNVVHQPSDTIQWISPVKLAEQVSLVSRVIEALQDKTSDWCRWPELEEET